MVRVGVRCELSEQSLGSGNEWRQTAEAFGRPCEASVRILVVPGAQVVADAQRPGQQQSSTSTYTTGAAGSARSTSTPLAPSDVLDGTSSPAWSGMLVRSQL